MIIYSEILSKQFNTVEECLAAEEQYNKKLKEDEARRKKEREEVEKLIHDCYETLVHAWENYEKVLTKAGASVDDMEDKALILVEVILDADNRKNHSLKS